MYKIYKQLVPGSDIWVVQLNPNDSVYEYNTLDEAEAALPEVQQLYPNNLCKVI